MNRKVEKLNGLSEYKTVSMRSEIESASPHRLIQMLLDGAVTKIAVAKGCIERSDTLGKCENIDWAMSIIGGLQGSLDLEKGGQIAENLQALYDYSARQLVVANSRNDTEILDEVSGLLNEIRSGWAGISLTNNSAAIPAEAV
ncbi:MAG: flagellar export chaperone FliS [Pseudomonadota bacterium]